MAGTTPVMGWTIPNASDELENIIAVFSAGITDIENSLNVVDDGVTATSTYSAYPKGISLAYVSTSGWPEAAGMVLTLRHPSGTSTQQLFFSGSVADLSRLYSRLGGSTGWSAWRLFGWEGQPTAEATGQVTGTPPTAGGTVAMPVTFPSGRFTSQPRVYLQAQTSLPGEVSVGVGSTTSTGCTIYLCRQSLIATSVQWHAIEGVES